MYKKQSLLLANTDSIQSNMSEPQGGKTRSRTWGLILSSLPRLARFHEGHGHNLIYG